MSQVVDILCRDSRDGKFSHSKLGVVIASLLFAVKMTGLVPQMPDDPVLWGVFMGTVGGYAALLKLVASLQKGQ